MLFRIINEVTHNGFIKMLDYMTEKYKVADIKFSTYNDKSNITHYCALVMYNPKF